MALAPVSARNRVSPLSVAMLDQTSGAYDEVELCTDPNCTVCQASGTRRRHHHHHHKHHHKRQHHKKDKTSFWNNFLPRGESSTSLVSVHSIQLDEARPRYREEVRERALVPVNQSERQVGTTTTTTRTNRVAEDEVLRDAWTNNRTYDDEIVCCRAYNGCRCPCWCCILLIALIVILVIVLIVLLATLL